MSSTRWSVLLVLLALVFSGCSHVPVGLSGNPRPALPLGAASPCGWQLLGNDAIDLPRSATTVWVCGLGWDDQPLTGQAVPDLLATIASLRIDPAQGCAGVDSQPFALFFDGPHWTGDLVGGQPSIGRTGLLGLPGDCFFAGTFDMAEVFAAIKAAFTAQHGGPAAVTGAGDPCHAPEARIELLDAAAPDIVVACTNPDWIASGMAGARTVRPDATWGAALSDPFSGARIQLKYFQASVPKDASVLRIGGEEGVRTVWFDGKDLYLPGGLIHQITPTKPALAALRQLTGR